MFLPRTLFFDAVNLISRYGATKSSSGMMIVRAIEEFPITLKCKTDSHSTNQLVGYGWKATSGIGGIITVTGSKKHLAQDDIDALVMLVRLSK